MRESIHCLFLFLKTWLRKREPRPGRQASLQVSSRAADPTVSTCGRARSPAGVLSVTLCHYWETMSGGGPLREHGAGHGAAPHSPFSWQTKSTLLGEGANTEEKELDHVSVNSFQKYNRPTLTPIFKHVIQELSVNP